MDLVWFMIIGMCAMNEIASACPENCQCRTSKILCQGFIIKEFPASIPPTTETLFISNTSIESLKPADFETFAETLTVFVAKDSRIAVVDPHTFDQTRNLIALGFSGTTLTSLPQDLFQNLKVLSTLTLSNNKLEDLQPSLLTPLTVLNNLDLSRNLLTSLAEDAFLGLGKLEQLMLQRNSIRMLHSSSFQGLSHLKALFLQQNHLTDIPAGVFDDLVNLEILHLQDNKISQLPANLFSNLSKLKKLYLSNNRLSLLPNAIFFNLPNLTHISLYENQLSRLTPGTFGPMALQELWLYDNMLTHLEENVFSNLTEIRLLVLSRNRIQHISPGAFSGLMKLEEISLHTNRLTTVEAGIFKGLPKLVNISIENNQIQHIPLKLLDGLPHLHLLELQNNSLQNLPKEFLNSLSIVDNIIVNQNPWRCDRDIIPFRDWLGQYPEKVKNLTSLMCFTPPVLNVRNIRDLKEDDFMVSQTPVVTTVDLSAESTPADSEPTEGHLPHTSPTKTSNSTTVPEDTSGGDAVGQGLSKDKLIIIIAIVCTAVIVGIIACVLWRRNKRGSEDLDRQRKRKTNSVI
ncbi:LOW QUALITY PROTEIN: leucine-rich repeat-containing protein 15 [Labeo rohita]|uniref:LOW QUALITY PROTEIN: leucine-rich repeat-containing protein 15 n=1 Tax=Labeo rohita TaxID=84645 RepID=UPI0021E347EC|nr:LOW QUALITY PROTEIN: leucine-rich repeat-containing protein 15 [Labeo rohita]